MATLLIADDHAIVRAGYRQFLASEGGIAEIGEVESGDATLSAVKRGKWDLLLLDLLMPGRCGLDVLEHLRTNDYGVWVLVISALPEQQYASHVLKAGARGYLSKTSSPEEFVRAVRTVLAGRIYMSSAVEKLIERVANRDKSDPPHACLSFRELQIFVKLARGTPVSDIATQLGVGSKTISTHRARILDKMHFQTNAQITAYALKSGIIQLGPPGSLFLSTDRVSA
jgi:DNA-binding NarL/FixJ family response regulator